MDTTLIRHAQQAFGQDYHLQLSDEQAQEAIERLSKLFDLLDQFDREDQSALREANGNQKLL